MTGNELLTSDEMALADRRAVARGVPSLTLMENAGRGVADIAWRHLQKGDRVLVLAGPGNNGGDGFVAARLLAERGCDVSLVLAGSREALKGDAAEMARRWAGGITPPDAQWPDDLRVIVDALFGAGLTRALDGDAAALAVRANQHPARVIAVDVPSGLDGSTGQVPGGPVIEADETVTFFRMKPGHVLYPGRSLCGVVHVVDIGIPATVLGDVDAPLSRAHVNTPDAWRAAYPWRAAGAHKYTHGHAVVVSGPAFQSGAARLGARGALRAGAGLVTVASPLGALPENAAQLTAVMLKPCAGARALAEILSDTRKTAVLIGPGAGIGDDTAGMVLVTLASGASVVLDADALTSFAEGGAGAGGTGFGFGFTSKAEAATHTPHALFDVIGRSPGRDVVLTPHEGEFARLFADLAGMPSKLERGRAAARRSGAVVLLKGPDTVIAAPDGRAAINTNAPPWLATAGSGDVLAGFVTGLVAQGMPAFEAACAAVWLHGECAGLAGPGLIAEDLPETLPRVLSVLHARSAQPGSGS